MKDYTNTVKCNYNYDALVRAPVIARAPLAMAAAPAAAASAPAVAVATQAQPGTVDSLRRRSGSPCALQRRPRQRRRRQRLLRRSQRGSRNWRKTAGFPGHPKRQGGRAAGNDLPRLSRPAGRPASDPINSHYVGTFNFFDAVPHGDDHPGHATGSKPVSFDVTNVAANLGASGLLKAEHTVTFVAANAPAASSKPVVGDISFVEQ